MSAAGGGLGWASRRGFLALGGAAFGAGRAWGCSRVARCPVRVVDGFPVVPAVVFGQSVSLLLDTGAQGMLVTPWAAEALRLPLRGMTRIFGTGGSSEARVVALPGLRLGGAPMPDLVAPVAGLPIELRTDPPLAGLLGAALLARFDVTLDIAGGTLELAVPDSCAAPGWAGAALEVSRAGEPFMAVQVNGATLLALVDTGSRATLIAAGAARRIGLSAPVSANTARGVDGERLPLGHTRARVVLPGQPGREVPVSIAPLQLERGDMLLGTDVLGRQAIWLGYTRGEIRLGAISG